MPKRIPKATIKTPASERRVGLPNPVGFAKKPGTSGKVPIFFRKKEKLFRSNQRSLSKSNKREQRLRQMGILFPLNLIPKEHRIGANRLVDFTARLFTQRGWKWPPEGSFRRIVAMPKKEFDSIEPVETMEEIVHEGNFVYYWNRRRPGRTSEFGNKGGPGGAR